MLEQNNYSNLSKEELLAKETKLKRNQKFSTIICFAAVANVLLGIYLHQSRGVFSIFLILGALFFIVKYGSELKKVQEEIKSRNDI